MARLPCCTRDSRSSTVSLAEGEPPIPLADEKSVAEGVTQARANQGRRTTMEAPAGSSVAALSGDDRDPSWMKAPGLDRCLPLWVETPFAYAHFVQPTEAFL